VAGSTLGMMLANVPAVYLGDKVAERISMVWVHGVSAVIFLALGVATLLNLGRVF
jgi:Ca2+/H+ antiporter, TMEM165/GDT1 family